MATSLLCRATCFLQKKKMTDTVTTNMMKQKKHIRNASVLAALTPGRKASTRQSAVPDPPERSIGQLVCIVSLSARHCVLCDQLCFPCHCRSSPLFLGVEKIERKSKRKRIFFRFIVSDCTLQQERTLHIRN